MGRLRDAALALFGSSSPRVSGPPPSGNGASSFHVWWDSDLSLAHVSVQLEVVRAPVVDRLYFFALQASMWSDKGHQGGAHTGLQWNQRHPGSTAVNWGGYHRNGGILGGTTSPLPSTPDDPNTRDYVWHPERAYRLAIGPRNPDGTWPATIEDVVAGEAVEIRSLHCDGDHLRAPVVWSEVFADCDHPGVEVRWSNLEATTTTGDLVRAERGRVSYQSHAAGGCANTDVSGGPDGVIQRTNTTRQTAADAVIGWPR